MKQKNPVLLLIGLILLIAGILFCSKTYQNSYAESVKIGNILSQIKTDISDTEKLLAETTDASVRQSLEAALTALKEEKEALSAEKLALEKPYSYSLILLFAGILTTIAGIVKLTAKVKPTAKTDLTKLAQAGLLAALCYIGFTFFKIDIPVGTEKTAFHLGNVFCVLAALLLGGFWGGLSGAVGMTIADLTTTYVTSAPKTFFLKLCIGLIVGLVAHKIFKLGKITNKKHIAGITVLASICGMGFNVIADPVVGYFYKTYLLGIPQDLSAALAKMSAITTFVNAVIAVITATIFYLALRPALKKAGFLKTE
ncbi:MAG: ECF transporter S component [Lachnospiraceae bacterium]|nr:ECF transporter S component [Lachnospiraceae bacterium]